VLRCHPEHGLTVAGIIGSAGDAARQGTSDLRITGLAGAIEAIDQLDPDGVVIGTSHLEPDHLNEIIHRQHLAGRSVMLEPGITRINFHSLQFSPVAYEPLLYVQKASLARIQHLMKRVFDTLSAALGLIVISPLLIAVGLMIKLSDRGPVFFKQRRVGQDGKTFEVYKYRTMVVGAEDRLAALKAENERHGPLFKMDDDPRVTRIGRFLRDSSLDELPQLFCEVR
jgi:lipopolysaccharide/colanic/teichoic acid biosynthesis glycosyltransferase